MNTSVFFNWHFAVRAGKQLLLLAALFLTGCTQQKLALSSSFTSLTSTVFGVTLSPLVAAAGGGIKNIAWTVTGSNTLAVNPIKLEYSLDSGTTWTTIIAATANTSPYAWSVPAATNLSTAQIRITVTPLTGSPVIATSSNFTIDSTLPAVSLTAMPGPYKGGSMQNIAWTASDAGTGLSSSAVSLSYSADNGVTWNAIAGATGIANSSPFVWVLPTLDASQVKVQIQVCDLASNCNTATTTAFKVDSTAPAVALTNFNAGAAVSGLTAPNITWTATDAGSGLAASPITLEYSTNAGSTWNTIVAATANTGTYSWAALPGLALNNTQMLVRITAVDQVGWSTQVAGAVFTVDSTAATLSAFQINSGATSTALPGVSFTIAGADNFAATQMQLNEASTPGATWIPYATSGNFTLTQSSGPKTVYAWVRDAAGNISSPMTANISLDFGSPPVVSITQPLTGGTYAASQNVHIEWSCSSANGLDANPVQIIYTTDDGVTFANVTGGLWVPNNLSATTGSYDWSYSGTGVPFRLLVQCKSAAGVVTSAYSVPQNTSGWTIYAGDPSSMGENVNASVALMSRTGSNFQTMSADLNGNVFFERNRAIMKVDAQTGLVTRVIGDPNYTGGSCTLAAGQVPINSAYSQISSNPFVLGPSPDRLSFYFSACGKTWSYNTTTAALTQIHTSAFGQYVGGFLSRTGKYFYSSGSRLYSVDLTLVNAAPVIIFGNSGSCAYPVAAVGTTASATPMVGLTDSTCTGETYVISNPDDSILWVGVWEGTGKQTNTVRLAWNSGVSAYQISSQDVGWNMNGAYGNCSPSFITNRVYCSGRYNNSVYASFDTNLATWNTTGMGHAAFIRYAPTPNGLVSLDSTNMLMSTVETSDTARTIFQIGGSNIETYGNGTDLSKVAFSTVDNITYSQGSQRLLVNTSASLRYFNMALTPVPVSTVAISYGYYGVTYNTVLSNDGLTLSNIALCTMSKQTFNGTVLGTAVSLANSGPVACYVSVPTVAYPIPDNTLVSGTIVAFNNWFNKMVRSVNHHNGKHYFFVKNRTTNADGYIYSSDGTNLKIVAGKTGPSGYSMADSGNLAIGATFQDVRYIDEVPAGKPNAGDLIITDGDRLRLITITTESATPKLYDLVDLTMANGTGYVAGTTTSMSDAYYDFSTEMMFGGNPVLGSGKFYYVTSGNAVHKVTPTALNGSGAVNAATDSTYSFAGTTLASNADGAQIRIALTPAGLLVTQPNKNRILRVAP